MNGIYADNPRCQKYMAACLKSCCKEPAHTVSVNHEQKIFAKEGL